MSKLMNVIGHKDILQTLRNSVIREKLAHAYLFVGPTGVGKKSLSEVFARVLLCESPLEGDLCGQCRSCGQTEAGNHPDLHLIQPTGASIKIEQIRELLRQVQFRPYQAKRQVFIIDMADAMTQEAANCFLKTLEEPAGQSHFILLSSRPNLLLETVLSRCLTLQFYPLSNREIADTLAKNFGIERDKAAELAPMAGGSMDRALKLVGNDQSKRMRLRILEMVVEMPKMSKVRALALAEEISPDRNDTGEYLETMLLLFRDMLVYNYTSDKKMLVNQDMAGQLSEYASTYGPAKLVAIIEEIMKARGKILTNANPRMTLEVLMLKIQSYGGLF